MSTGERRVGRVVNGYSNALAALIADARVAATYRGPSDASPKRTQSLDDYERACEAMNGELDLPGGKAIVVDIGGCGSAFVHRLGDAFVIPEHYMGEDDVDAEAALDLAIATHPTTDAEKVGSVDVTSGVLVMMGLLEEGPAVDVAEVLERGVVKVEAGCAIAVKPGRYDVWREEFPNEVSGVWGTMPSRVRVVPDGTPVVAGAPIVQATEQASVRGASAPARRRASAGERRLVDPEGAWVAIRSIAVADDGRTFAGECGRFGVAAWDAAGSLLWQRRIRPQDDAHYSHNAVIALAGEDLVVLCSSLGELVVLDGRTGVEKRKLSMPDPRAARMLGDRLVVRASVKTEVLSYPSLERIAVLPQYANGKGIACSHDGGLFAVDGHECHVFDAKTLEHVRTIRPERTSWDVAFTHDGLLVTGADDARIELWDPRTGERAAVVDGAEERSRKPSINAIDTSKRHLALSRSDGTVVVLDVASKTVLHRYEKHLVTIPATGATALEDIAFSRDGDTLWVSAGPKNAPVGLTGYALESGGA